MPNFQLSKPPKSNRETELLENQEIEEQLANLQHSHSLRYQIMNLEIWALVNTMDDFLPGFWSRFMFNRQVSLREFLERKKAQHS